MWQELVEHIKKQTKEGRELSYTDGFIGITALLHCPLKWELSRGYDVDVSAVEIDDGFVWERQVKESLKELYGEKFKEEFDLIDEELGLHGHLDCLVEEEDRVIGIELKAPKFLLFREPYTGEGTLFYDDGRVIHNELYLTQARIEKALLKRLFPDKKVELYLFYKALCKSGLWNRKLYVVSEIKEEQAEEEIKKLIERFHTDKSPRYAGECENYCAFHKLGLCEGKEFKPEEIKEEEKKEVLSLLKHYRALQSDLKSLEFVLKKKLKGSIRFGDKEIGWIKRKSVELNKERVLELLDREELKEYVLINWQKKGELIKRFGGQVVKEEKEILEWRI